MYGKGSQAQFPQSPRSISVAVAPMCGYILDEAHVSDTVAYGNSIAFDAEA